MIVVRCKNCGFIIGLLKINLYKVHYKYGYCGRNDYQYDLLMLKPFKRKLKDLSDFVEIVYDYFRTCPRCGVKLNKSEKELRIKPKKRKVHEKIGKRILLLREW